MRRGLANILIVAAIFGLLVANYLAIEARSTRGYAVRVDHVYAATVKAVAMQRHSVRAQRVEHLSPPPVPQTRYDLDSQLRMKPFGSYVALMSVTGANDSAIVTVLPGVFPRNFLFRYAGGQEEVRKVFVRLDEEICPMNRDRCPSKPPR